MDELLSLKVLSRWIHIGTVIVLVGGSVFLRFVLLPAASQLSEDQHDRLRELVMSKWRKFAGIGIGLLLLSGFYNYVVVSAPLHKGDGLYAGLLGTKIILAFVVFFLVSALTGRSKRLAGIRDNSSRWLSITILLAAIIVAISGYVKVAVKPTHPASQENVPTQSTQN
jgi:uncharacterized membrane protein